MLKIPQEYRIYIKKRLDKGEDFALFRMPGSNRFHIAGKDGYDIDLVKFGEPYANAIRVGSHDYTGAVLPPFPRSTDNSPYLDSVAALAKYHVARRGKTVISRVIAGKSNTGIDPLDVAERYFDVNPAAFCALVFTPATGMWIVATPELLLSADEVNLHTMSLAGTRPNRVKGPWNTEVEWDQKNRDEQAMVTDFIVSKWQSIGLTPQTEPTHTLRSNNVEHLCTLITAKRIDSVPLANILDATSPTPAVCGLPREAGLVNISVFERHERQLYAGYMAVTHPDGRMDAFVTLRCARIDTDGRYAIYVGGGITSGSQPEAELKETNLKALYLQMSLTTNQTTPFRS